MTRINIDDDMIERAHGVLSRFTDMVGDNHGIIQKALQAALDRRTGPKDRRVEWDDTKSNVHQRRCALDSGPNGVGRREYDASWINLPRKSGRLKREAEEREKQKAQEIHVSDEMRAAGHKRYWDVHGYIRANSPTIRELYAFQEAYVAMRLQEMKERGDV